MMKLFCLKSVTKQGSLSTTSIIYINLEVITNAMMRKVSSKREKIFVYEGYMTRNLANPRDSENTSLNKNF
jgi:hypothetical protein